LKDNEPRPFPGCGSEFDERGKRRMHQKPKLAEVRACQPWLEAEISAVHRQIIACPGLTKERGKFVAHVMADLQKGARF
jgi:uracil-DNA glycosylase